MTHARKSAKSTVARTAKLFSDEERAAIQDRAKEQKAAAGQGPRSQSEDGESDLLAKIAEMPESDRALATRLHSVIKDKAPSLSSRLWYGMPAYAKDGNVICFFQGAYKFKTRYATLGFSDSANFDAGHLWPVAFALTELTTADETAIDKLLTKAVS
jgi:hypothetical protein